MKIAFMTRWNAACGTSLLGELIGRELLKMGHELHILAPSNDDKLFDEPAREEVKRCYSIYRFGWRVVEEELDPEPFLDLDYDIFLAQGFTFITCVNRFREIFPRIKGKAKTVYIVHERTLDSSPFAEFDWDALVCFDERYKRMVGKAVREEKCRTIPYPYHPVVRGDREEARRRLDLPRAKKIVLSFGWRARDYLPLLPILEEVSERFPLNYLVVADPRVAPELTELKEKEFVELRYEVPPTDRLYTYLHASDCLLLYREEARSGELVVSSIVHMCLGSLTPIVTSATRYVEMLEDEVVKYSDLRELKDRLIRVFEDRAFTSRVRRAAERLVKENSAERIAREYVSLFESLLSG